jgi:hypothetical protein
VKERSISMDMNETQWAKIKKEYWDQEQISGHIFFISK